MGTLGVHLATSKKPLFQIIVTLIENLVSGRAVGNVPHPLTVQRVEQTYRNSTSESIQNVTLIPLPAFHEQPRSLVETGDRLGVGEKFEERVRSHRHQEIVRL